MKFDVLRNQRERGETLSEFFYPKKYPFYAANNMIAFKPGVVENLEINLDPKLPCHRVYVHSETAVGIASLFGSLNFYRQSTKILSIPWGNILTSDEGRFGLRSVGATSTNTLSPDAMLFKVVAGTVTYINPFTVFGYADKAQFEIEQIRPGSGTTFYFTWCILSSI